MDGDGDGGNVIHESLVNRNPRLADYNSRKPVTNPAVGGDGKSLTVNDTPDLRKHLVGQVTPRQNHRKKFLGKTEPTSSFLISKIRVRLSRFRIGKRLTIPYPLSSYMIKRFTPILTGAVITLAALAPVGAENRSIDGTGNSTGNRGAANTPFIRVSPASYGDGLSSLAGANRPNARDLSQRLCNQDKSRPNRRNATDYLWQWGQFVDHDITLSPANTGESASIPVTNENDVLYNPGLPLIPMDRTDYIIDDSGIRQQVNAVTSFIDASNVYGSDETTAAALRTFSGGRMKTSPDGMLPNNTVGLPMAGVGTVPGIPADEFRMAGDIRANEQPCLTAMHTLFVHEHNRLAEELASSHPDWSDELLYQGARKIVGALMQSITYNEWLPALLGPAAPDPVSFNYDPRVDPGISNVFATALFRFGHTMVSPRLMRIQNDNFPDEIASQNLMDSFFNPPTMESHETYEVLLKGMSCQIHQAADARIISELRNTLFGPAGSGGMDLAALNIQRGRDHGLPDYNTIRTAYGLTPINTWQDLSSDPTVQANFSQAYASPNDLDVWTAALSEDHLAGAAVGETIAASISSEFTRLANGDRFFYLWDPALPPALRKEITQTTLSQIIGRNSNLTLQENVFFVSGHPLLIQEIAYKKGIGVQLSFMGKPGYEYRIKYGSKLDDLSLDLFETPLSSGDSSYMLQWIDNEANNIGERFYQLSETAVNQ